MIARAVMRRPWLALTVEAIVLVVGAVTSSPPIRRHRARHRGRSVEGVSPATIPIRS